MIPFLLAASRAGASFTAGLLAAAWLCNQGAQADNLTWTGTTSSDFTVPTNWSPNGSPDGNNDSINTAAGNLATIGANVTGATFIQVGYFTGGADHTGIVNQTGGTVTVTGGGLGIFLVGFGGAGSNGTYNLTGGTLQFADGRSSVGGSSLVAAGGTGAINLTNGTIQANAGAGFSIGQNSGTGTVTVNNGGVLNVPAAGLGLGSGPGATGTLTLNPGAAVSTTTGSVTVGSGGGTGVLNLDGGTLTTGAVAGSGTFHLNGGTLKAAGASTGFITTPTTDLKAGGAIIDTNGFDATIAAALGANSVSTGGGLTKLGAGALTLSGNNTYTGATVISGGTLRLAGSPTAPTTLPAGLQVLPLGDSITYGAYGTNAGYRGPLYSSLAAIAPGVQFIGVSNYAFSPPTTLPTAQAFHCGMPSYTIQESNTNLDGYDATAYTTYGGGERDPQGGNWFTGITAGANAPLWPNGRAALAPDLILMMLGTNDLSNQTGVQGRIEAIVTKITTLRPAAKLIVAKITPSTSNPGAVTSYNMIVAAVVAEFQAAGKNVYLADMNTGFPANGLADGTHPNDTGYAFMAQQWSAAILNAYSTPSSSSTGIPASSAVSVANNATLDLHGLAASVGAISGQGAITLGTGGVLTTGVPALTNANFQGVISGTGGLNVPGPGALTLSGANTYTGATTVSGGSLTIQGSLAAGAPVTVNRNALLAGTGTISGNVTLGNGAQLAPGNGGAGTLRVSGTLTVNNGSVLSMELAGTGTSDKLALANACVANGTTTVNLTTVAGFAGAGTYPLITGAPGINAANFTLGTMPAGLVGNLSAANGTLSVILSVLAPPTGFTATPGDTQVALNWTAAPGATSYLVRRGTASGSYTSAFSVAGTSAIDSPLTNGVTYYYAIAAVNASGPGANSPEISAIPSPVISPAESSGARIDLSGTGGSSTTVTFHSSVVGHLYTMQSCTDLPGGIWTNIGSTMAGTGGDLPFPPITIAGSAGFYRVLIQRP